MRLLLAACLILACALPWAPARAQGPGAPDGLGALPVLPQSGELTLAAYHAETGAPILEGLIWRVFALRGEEPELVARDESATPRFKLPPANYMIHVSYGFASSMRLVTMQWGDVVERLVVAEARPTDLIRLPEGDYHVVSTFGDANASMRTDVSVQAGQVTIATLNHRAARVTLKLVAEEGGEAFAGTAFSVLTPGGDVVREAIGAFPSVVLAEGDYVLIARHEGRVFTREFRVESGLDRDLEALAEG